MGTLAAVDQQTLAAVAFAIVAALVALALLPVSTTIVLGAALGAAGVPHPPSSDPERGGCVNPVTAYLKYKKTKYIKNCEPPETIPKVSLPTAFVSSAYRGDLSVLREESKCRGI